MNHHSKYNLHSKKLKIFKHHVKFLLLMSVHEQLQIKEQNGRFFCGIVVALFFVQTTNESK